MFEETEIVKECYDVSWQEFDDWCVSIANQVKNENWVPDLIVGVARGGMVPATRLAYLLDVKTVLAYSKETTNAVEISEWTKFWFSDRGLRPANILLVDDINDSGETLSLVIKSFDECMYPESYFLRTAAPLTKLSSEVDVDYFGKMISDLSFIPWPWNNLNVWWVFPWERKDQDGQETD